MAREYDASNRYDLEEFINKVANKILATNMCLFIGAGSSIQYGTVSWDELIKGTTNLDSNLDNLQKAEYDNLISKDLKIRIAEKLSKNEYTFKSDTYLNYLLDFDFNSIWTTNYDNLIESVLAQKKKRYFPIYEFNHFQQLSYPKGIHLFKINGSYESPDSIVITKNDFIDYKKTHEGFLLLLKRDLLCNSMLFLGCSFDDDILRISIKDIIHCIDDNDTNKEQNYSTEHFAIVTESNQHKLDYICMDMKDNYRISCLKLNKPQKSYLLTKGIAEKVKLTSIFISGAKKFQRHSEEEEKAICICRDLVLEFINIEEFNIEQYPYKFISGMGMSIGNFISGPIKQMDEIRNINRYLDMQPFPFTGGDSSKIHRHNIIRKAGIFIFMYGDKPKNDNIENSGMWTEYDIARQNRNGIIISLPCGTDSISTEIYINELHDKNSFSNKYKNIIEKFDYTNDNKIFFKELKEKVNLEVRKKMDYILDEISESIK